MHGSAFICRNLSMKTLGKFGPGDFSTIFDVAHLDRQTMGDAALRAEVLVLFHDQLRLRQGELPSADASARVVIAHALCGAARGVGATEIAVTSRQLENAPADSAAYDALMAAIVRTRAALETLESRGARG